MPRRILSFILLTAVLFIVPAMSWLYLQNGKNYRKSKLKDLHDFGAFTLTAPLTDGNGNPFTADSLKKGFFIVTIMKDAADQNTAKQLQRLQTAFEPDRTDVHLLSILPADAKIKDFEAENKIKPRMWHVVSAAEPEKVAADLKLNLNAKIDSSYFVLLDTARHIRRYYNVQNTAQVNAMAEIIAMIMKPKPTPKIKYKKPEDR